MTKETKKEIASIVDDIQSMSAEANQKFREKIFACGKALTHFEKDGHVAFGNTDYRYPTVENITKKAKEALIANRLLLQPTTRETKLLGRFPTKQGEQFFYAVDVEFLLMDLDSNLMVSSIYHGVGSDVGDKAIYKAYSGAFKRFVSEFFQVPGCDEEPESHENEARGESRISRVEFIPDGNPWVWELENSKKYPGHKLYELPLDAVRMIAERADGNDGDYARAALKNKEGRAIAIQQEEDFRQTVKSTERVLGAKEIKTGTAHMGIEPVPFEDDEIPY